MPKPGFYVPFSPAVLWCCFFLSLFYGLAPSLYSLGCFRSFLLDQVFSTNWEAIMATLIEIWGGSFAVGLALWFGALSIIYPFQIIKQGVEQM